MCQMGPVVLVLAEVGICGESLMTEDLLKVLKAVDVDHACQALISE